MTHDRWAAGLERLSLLCSQFDTRLAPSVDVVVVHLSDRTVDAQTKKEIMRQAQAVLHDLRQHRICSSISYKTSMKEQLKLANKVPIRSDIKRLANLLRCVDWSKVCGDCWGGGIEALSSID